ncbi:MAG: DinB family protein [Maribacter sp.]|nr:DinB family protein [Maribacter sp.]
MLIETLQKIFKRDLEKLRIEIDLYNSESSLWVVDKNITNSGGNLCLHLLGNLNTFIGGVLGKTGYIRDREAEFSLKNVPKTELMLKIDDLIVVVDRTLSRLTHKQLHENYPVLVFKDEMTVEYFLVHLASHLSYHLGQINYHRRFFDR